MVAVIGPVPGVWAGPSAGPPATTPKVDRTEVHFLRDPESGRVAVQVVDSVTGDEIRQIPPEEMMKALASIRKAIGLVLDERG